MSVYTAGIWTVRPGHEDEFVALWTELAGWSSTAFAGAQGTLLRDREQPNRFLSYGSWDDDDQIAAWRAAPEWEAYIGRMSPLLNDFQPRTYDLAAGAG